MGCLNKVLAFLINYVYNIVDLKGNRRMMTNQPFKILNAILEKFGFTAASLHQDVPGFSGIAFCILGIP